MKHLLLCAENHMATNSPILFSILFSNIFLVVCMNTTVKINSRVSIHTQLGAQERSVEVESLIYFTQTWINLYQAKNNFDVIFIE